MSEFEQTLDGGLQITRGLFWKEISAEQKRQIAEIKEARQWRDDLQQAVAAGVLVTYGIGAPLGERGVSGAVRFAREEVQEYLGFGCN